MFAAVFTVLPGSWPRTAITDLLVAEGTGGAARPVGREPAGLFFL